MRCNTFQRSHLGCHFCFAACCYDAGWPYRTEHEKKIYTIFVLFVTSLLRHARCWRRDIYVSSVRVDFEYRYIPISTSGSSRSRLRKISRPVRVLPFTFGLLRVEREVACSQCTVDYTPFLSLRHRSFTAYAKPQFSRKKTKLVTLRKEKEMAFFIR